MAFILHFIVVVAIIAAIEGIWTFYIQNVTRGNGIRAASASGAICLGANIVTITFVNDHRYVVAAVLGSFLGTLITVRSKKRESPADVGGNPSK